MKTTQKTLDSYTFYFSKETFTFCAETEWAALGMLYNLIGIRAYSHSYFRVNV